MNIFMNQSNQYKLAHFLVFLNEVRNNNLLVPRRVRELDMFDNSEDDLPNSNVLVHDSLLLVTEID